MLDRGPGGLRRLTFAMVVKDVDAANNRPSVFHRALGAEIISLSKRTPSLGRFSSIASNTKRLLSCLYILLVPVKYRGNALNCEGTSNSPALISLRDVCQSYRLGKQIVPVLRHITLTVQRGETCALLGASGSGKSTLLNILGLLDRPASGEFYFGRRNVLGANADELALIRNHEIGFVFQAFNLLPRLTALDNVALPLRYRGVARRRARELSMEQLRNVGLADRAGHRPADLSGGQRQRVAIARALIGGPSVILADEPTGNLDSATADGIMALLLALNREHDVTLIMVTHDAALARRFGRQLRVQSGTLYESSSIRAAGNV